MHILDTVLTCVAGENVATIMLSDSRILYISLFTLEVAIAYRVEAGSYTGPLLLYFAMEQSKHAELPWKEYDPAAHIVQVEDCALEENTPEAHVMHCDWPEELENWPAEQFEQTEL